MVDGPAAGWQTQPYGGRWDRFHSVDAAGNPVGKFVSVWHPGKGWLDEHGQPSAAVESTVIKVAAQSIEAIEDWTSKLILVLGGRRSGKTTGTLAPKLIALLIVFAGSPGCVLSPTYRQSMNVWRAVLKLAPKTMWAEKNKSERRLRTVTGSELVLLSADRDDSSRSEGCAWQVNDERQDIGDEAASNAQLSASEASGPAAHIIIETATIKPELRDHFDKVVASPKGAVYWMNSYGNPFTDHAFLDDAKEFLDAERIEREIYGRWPELVGRCYYPYDEAVHRVDYPAPRMEDATSAFCAARMGSAFASCEYILAADPPAHAGIARVYRDDTIHIVDEIVIGADGRAGDIRSLAKACRARIGSARACIIFDPHETHWDDDARKYFKAEGFIIAMLPRVHIEYRLTAVRSRLEKGKLLIDSRCRHLRESLRDQTYDELTHKPSKKTPSRITPAWTLDHPVDWLGYLVYKFWKAKVDYEKLERAA